MLLKVQEMLQKRQQTVQETPMVQAWTSLYMDGTLVFDLPIYMKPKFGHRWYISRYKVEIV